MTGGQHDSSKTRVIPVLDALWESGRSWLPELLALPRFGAPSSRIDASADLALLEGYWGPNEKGLDPPVSLLSWLVRHLWTMGKRLEDGQSSDERGRRADLLTGEPGAIGEALHMLRSEYTPRAWYVFEGPTYPDALLVARDALVVIEGKRTESGPTRRTSWLKGRHQIWRHLDAAWEVRGRRAVYGFFIVEGDASNGGLSVPEAWRNFAANALSPEVLATSFPHRSATEVQNISSSFIGVTTWRQVCARFGLDWRLLPDTVGGSVPNTQQSSAAGCCSDAL